MEIRYRGYFGVEHSHTVHWLLVLIFLPLRLPHDAVAAAATTTTTTTTITTITTLAPAVPTHTARLNPYELCCSWSIRHRL